MSVWEKLVGTVWISSWLLWAQNLFLEIQGSIQRGFTHCKIIGVMQTSLTEVSASSLLCPSASCQLVPNSNRNSLFWIPRHKILPASHPLQSAAPAIKAQLEESHDNDVLCLAPLLGLSCWRLRKARGEKEMLLLPFPGQIYEPAQTPHNYSRW